jgi:hypothetical protein
MNGVLPCPFCVPAVSCFVDFMGFDRKDSKINFGKIKSYGMNEEMFFLMYGG